MKMSISDFVGYIYVYLLIVFIVSLFVIFTERAMYTPSIRGEVNPKYFTPITNIPDCQSTKGYYLVEYSYTDKNVIFRCGSQYFPFYTEYEFPKKVIEDFKWIKIKEQKDVK